MRTTRKRQVIGEWLAKNKMHPAKNTEKGRKETNRFEIGHWQEKRENVSSNLVALNATTNRRCGYVRSGNARCATCQMALAILGARINRNWNSSVALRECSKQKWEGSEEWREKKQSRVEMKNLRFSIWHSVRYTFNELNVVGECVRAEWHEHNLLINCTRAICAVVVVASNREYSVLFLFGWPKTWLHNSRPSCRLRRTWYSLKRERIKITLLLELCSLAFAILLLHSKLVHSAQTGTNSNLCQPTLPPFAFVFADTHST